MKKKIRLMILTVIMTLMAVGTFTVNAAAQSGTNTRASGGPIITDIRLLTPQAVYSDVVVEAQVTYQNAASGVDSVYLDFGLIELGANYGGVGVASNENGTLTVQENGVFQKELGRQTLRSVTIRDRAGNSRTYEYNSAKNKLVDESGQYTINGLSYVIQSYDKGVFVEDIWFEKNGKPVTQRTFAPGENLDVVLKLRNQSDTAFQFTPSKCEVRWRQMYGDAFFDAKSTGTAPITVAPKGSAEVRLSLPLGKSAPKGDYYINTLCITSVDGKRIWMYGSFFTGHSLEYEGKLITIPWGGSESWEESKVDFTIKAEAQEPSKPQKPSQTEKPSEPSKPSKPDKKVKVKKVKVIGEKSAAEGSKIQLKVKISPSNATNKDVKWTSSNKKVATINAKGVVTLKKNSGGKTVTITATAKDGSGKKGTIKIKSEKKRGKVKSIKISGKKQMKAGKTQKLKATVKVQGSAPKKVKWTVDNKKYATVNASGTVKAKKAGKGKTIRVTAKATDRSGKKATFKIKIK